MLILSSYNIHVHGITAFVFYCSHSFQYHQQQLMELNLHPIITGLKHLLFHCVVAFYHLVFYHSDAVIN